MKQIKGIVEFLVLLTLASCGSTTIGVRLPDPVALSELEPDVQKIVGKFMRYNGGKPLVSTSITVGELPRNKVGVCYATSKRIIFNEYYWEIYSDAAREYILFHELGHCEFGDREHRDDRLEDGCPTSVMNTYVMPEICYGLHYRHYMIELFGRDSDQYVHPDEED